MLVRPLTHSSIHLGLSIVVVVVVVAIINSTPSEAWTTAAEPALYGHPEADDRRHDHHFFYLNDWQLQLGKLHRLSVKRRALATCVWHGRVRLTATMSCCRSWRRADQQQCRGNIVECYKSNDFFDKVETNWTCSIKFCSTEAIGRDRQHCCQKRQQCRSIIWLCRKDEILR